MFDSTFLPTNGSKNSTLSFFSFLPRYPSFVQFTRQKKTNSNRVEKKESREYPHLLFTATRLPIYRWKNAKGQERKTDRWIIISSSECTRSLPSFFFFRLFIRKHPNRREHIIFFLSTSRLALTLCTYSQFCHNWRHTHTNQFLSASWYLRKCIIKQTKGFLLAKNKCKNTSFTKRWISFERSFRSWLCKKILFVCRRRWLFFCLI